MIFVRLGPFEDDETNHDPDSWNDEEDDRGFDDMPAEYWLDEPASDDGFEDAGDLGEDEDEGAEEDDEDE